MSLRIVHFTVDDIHCAIDVTGLRSIVRGTQAEFRQGEAHGLALVYQGNEVPVLDLRERLGLNRSNSAENRQILVTSVNDRDVAVAVDRVHGLVQVAPAEIFPQSRALGQALHPAVDNLLLPAGHFLIFQLSVERLLQKAGEEVCDTEVKKGPKPSVDGLEGTLSMVLFEPAQMVQNGLPVFFGLAMGQVADVVREATLHRAPLRDPELIGFLVWRGRPVPVVQLNRCFNLPASREYGMRYLVLRTTCPGQYLAVTSSNRVQIQKASGDYTPLSRKHLGGERMTLGFFESQGRRIVVPDLGVFADFGARGPGYAVPAPPINSSGEDMT